MLTDVEIALNADMLPIKDICYRYGIDEDDLELYGKYKAKLSNSYLNKIKDNKKGKLVLVTAVNPTPAGEGKTTISIGLAQALNKLNKKAVLALREPSLGPVFGIKGGAAGGGYSQLIPMDELNLHFTGDFHAITSANNLLCALLDNHLNSGNELHIDTNNIKIKRCLDMNDRVLRNVVIGLGGKTNGVTREDSFVITVATEIMAVLCLADDMDDLKKRLGNIIVAYNIYDKPVYARDLNAVGAMSALLKDTIKPNVIQTLENTLAIVHGGPFANIAHGCNSVIATKAAMSLSDITVTEAGFGADLGAEKFLDIKCTKSGIAPDAVVLVVTIRALKYNGGVEKSELNKENIEAMKKGCVNLAKHYENLSKYGVPIVIAVNNFYTDTEAEREVIKEFCEKNSCDYAFADVFEKGGDGGISLAEKVILSLENKKSDFKPLYDINLSIEEKVEKIVKEIYGGEGVVFSPKAKKEISRLKELNLTDVPICMAKTQYSLSDNPNLLGRPEGFTVTIRDLYISNGAGFIVCLAGDIMTMPGLPKLPAANKIDVDNNGNIVGIF